MKLPDWTIGQYIALFLAIVGVVVGVAALIVSNPFLGLFGITIVCSAGVAALLGLQN